MKSRAAISPRELRGRRPVPAGCGLGSENMEGGREGEKREGAVRSPAATAAPGCCCGCRRREGGGERRGGRAGRAPSPPSPPLPHLPPPPPPAAAAAACLHSAYPERKFLSVFVNDKLINDSSTQPVPAGPSPRQQPSGAPIGWAGDVPIEGARPGPLRSRGAERPRGSQGRAGERRGRGIIAAAAAPPCRAGEPRSAAR